MRIHQILGAIAAAGLLAASASPPDGQYVGALTRILTEARAGTCSELMTAGVQLACQRQIQSIALTLERFGSIQTISLIKSEERSAGLVETYEVVFVGGNTMTWIIGGLRDGQFSTAFAEGQ